MVTRRSLLAGAGAIAGMALVGGTGTAAAAGRGGVDCGPEVQLRARVDLTVPVRTRQGWGANEKHRFDPGGKEIWPPAYYRAQVLAVHHTGTGVAADPARTVQAVYYDDAVNEGYGDIGYHLLIDPDGVVYEGRYSGADCVPVFDAAGSAMVSNGGHIHQWNAGSIGICLLGNFETAQPSEEALDSLVRAVAVLCALGGLRPEGTAGYRNPINGNTRTVPTVSGHRDWVPNLCPGANLAARLPWVRAEAAKLVDA